MAACRYSRFKSNLRIATSLRVFRASARAGVSSAASSAPPPISAVRKKSARVASLHRHDPHRCHHAPPGEVRDLPVEGCYRHFLELERSCQEPVRIARRVFEVELRLFGCIGPEHLPERLDVVALLLTYARRELLLLAAQGPPALDRGIEGGLQVLDLQQPLQDPPVLLARRLRRGRPRQTAKQHARGRQCSTRDGRSRDDLLAREEPTAAESSIYRSAIVRRCAPLEPLQHISPQAHTPNGQSHSPMGHITLARSPGAPSRWFCAFKSEF